MLITIITKDAPQKVRNVIDSIKRVYKYDLPNILVLDNSENTKNIKKNKGYIKNYKSRKKYYISSIEWNNTKNIIWKSINTDIKLLEEIEIGSKGHKTGNLRNVGLLLENIIINNTNEPILHLDDDIILTQSIEPSYILKYKTKTPIGLKIQQVPDLSRISWLEIYLLCLCDIHKVPYFLKSTEYTFKIFKKNGLDYFVYLINKYTNLNINKKVAIPKETVNYNREEIPGAAFIIFKSDIPKSLFMNNIYSEDWIWAKYLRGNIKPRFINNSVIHDSNKKNLLKIDYYLNEEKGHLIDDPYRYFKNSNNPFSLYLKYRKNKFINLISTINLLIPKLAYNSKTYKDINTLKKILLILVQNLNKISKADSDLIINKYKNEIKEWKKINRVISNNKFVSNKIINEIEQL